MGSSSAARKAWRTRHGGKQARKHMKCKNCGKEMRYIKDDAERLVAIYHCVNPYCKRPQWYEKPLLK